MKILLISERFYPQVVGSGTSAYLIAKELFNRGHEITVATDLAIKSLLGKEELPFKMCYIEDFENYILGKASFQNPARDLYKIFLKNRFDVIQVNNLMPMMIVNILKPYITAPIVFTIHNTPNGSKRAIGYFQESPLDIQLAKKIVQEQAYEYVVNGSKNYEDFARRLGVKEYNMKTAYFGIDQEQLLSDLVKYKNYNINEFFDSPLSEDTILITLPARITPNKGILEAVESLQYFSNYTNVKLLLTNMVDPFNEAYANQVLEKARELSVDTKLLVPNRVIPRHILPAIYERSNIVITPSHYEGLGLSAIEALLVGRPLVATSAPGLDEIVTNEYNGLLVPPQKPKALADAMIRLISDKKLRQTFEENARKSVEKFDIKKHVDVLESTYTMEIKKWPKH